MVVPKMTQVVSTGYEFGPFRLDSAQRLLFREGQPLALEPKVLETLLALVENSGQLIEKEALIKRVWPDTFVEEGNLTRNIHHLRKVLGKDPSGREYIETVPRRGYRFVAEVQRSEKRSDSYPEGLAEARPNPEAGPAIVLPSQPQPWKRWVAVGLVSLLAAVLAFYFLRGKQQTSPPTGGRPSVAVLGLDNLSGRPDQAWISNALSEMLTAELSAGDKLRTIPGENVARMRADLSLPPSATLSRETLSRIHRILGNNLVVAGSYLNISGEVRVDLHVQDTSTGETIAVLSDSSPEPKFLELVKRLGDSLRQKCGAGQITPTEATAIRAYEPASPDAARLYAEGLARLRAFDPLSARDLLQRAVAEDPKSLLAHSALSAAWTQLGYDGNAAQEAKAAFDLSKGLSRRDSLAIEAAYHETTREWGKAVDLYKSLWTFFPDDLEYGLRLADAQTSAGEGQAALATTVNLHSLPPPSRDDPRIDLAEARAADSLSDYKRSRAAALRAGEKAAQLHSNFLLAQSQLQQCWALRNLGEYAEAKAVGQQAQALLAASKDFRGRARNLTCLGNVLADEGNLTGAMTMHQQALALARQVGAERDIAGALINVGNILASQQAIEDSTKRYQEALSVAMRVGDTPDALLAQNNIAANLMLQGDYTAAKDILERALNLATQSGDQGSVVDALTNLGTIAYLRGDLSTAGQQLEASLKKSREIGLKSKTAAAMVEMGELLLAQGDLVGSEKNYTGSFALRTELGEKWGIADCKNFLAALALEKGQATQSESLAREAAQEFRAEKDEDQETAARDRIAQALIAAGRLQDAQLEIDSATRLSAHDEPKKLSLQITSARLSAKKGRVQESLRALALVLRRATDLKLVGYQLLARLAQAETQAAGGDSASARTGLQRLKADAAGSGFHLIGRKAAAAESLLPH
jgi:DNA-binding winged helix-turn-helix (wHTH) protein/Tfp pilus assembly protein PilF/TolB-like protein